MVTVVNPPISSLRETNFQETDFKEPSIENFIKFRVAKEQDPVQLFECTERTGSLLARLVNETKEVPITVGKVYEKLSILYEDPSLAPYLKQPSYAGYLRIIEKLDDLMIAEVKIEEVSELQRNPIIFTTTALARHMLTVSYTQELMRTPPPKSPDNLEVQKIVLSDLMLMQTELQTLQKEHAQIIPNSVDVQLITEVISADFNCFAELGIRFFNSKETARSDALEIVLASLNAYYKDSSEVEARYARALMAHKSSIQKKQFAGLVSGLRSEVLSYGYLSTVVDEVTSEINSKEPVDEAVTDEVATRRHFIRLLQDNYVEAGYSLSSIELRHAPPDIDRAGIADMYLCAKVTKTTSALKSESVPKLVGIMLIEVKTEYIESDAVVIAGGAYPRTTKAHGVAVQELEDITLQKSTPDAALNFVKRTGTPILSVRFAQQAVAEGSKKGTKEQKIVIGGKSQLANIKDFHALSNIDETTDDGRSFLLDAMDTITKRTCDFRNALKKG